jgi:hypothetical protein
MLDSIKKYQRVLELRDKTIADLKERLGRGPIIGAGRRTGQMVFSAKPTYGRSKSCRLNSRFARATIWH